MKNMQKKSKLIDVEEEDAMIALREERRQRRQHRNWKHAWMEFAHEAEEHDEFYR